MSNEQISENVAPAATKPAKKSGTKKGAPKKATKSVEPAKKAAAKKPSTAPKSKAKRTNKKAEVLDLMRCPGVTLAEIMEATGWQAHTVRGFVGILASKGGEKIESMKSAGGDRTYRIAR